MCTVAVWAGKSSGPTHQIAQPALAQLEQGEK